MKFWRRGERDKIARCVGMRPHYLSEILHRKRSISTKLAMDLELASLIILRGNGVPKGHWVFNKYTEHPAFFGKPKPIPRKLK